MRLLGIGVDVVGISRLARVRAQRPALLGHLCTPEELSVPLDDERAARLWTGKEAVAKTLGTGFWQQGVDWPDIQFLPQGGVVLAGRAAAIAGPSVVAVDFSRAGDRLLAVAFRWERAP